MKAANKNLISKLVESIVSVLPIALIISVLLFFVVPTTAFDISKFLVSTVFLIVGMFLFSVGSDSSMLSIGQQIGGSLSKSRSLIIFIACSFLLGFVMTIAEPDLAVLAGQVLNVNKWLFMVVVAIGSAIFVTLGVLRIIFQVKITTVLAITYGIILVLMFFVPAEFLPIAFDASAVTTGPISTPFLLAFGLAVSAVRSSKNSQQDSFGFVALASAGPILMVMLLGFFAPTTTNSTASIAITSSTGTVGTFFEVVGKEFLSSMLEVGSILLALFVIFLIFNYKMVKLPKQKIRKILIGIIFTFFGISIFLTGVNVGYLPIASMVGYFIASEGMIWLLFLFTFLFGACIIFAEPAVHILVKKVKEVTQGAISQKTMFICLSIGVVLSLTLSVLRVMFDIPFLYIVFPCYAVIIGLSFFTPELFSAIAFDSGGVATGTMAVSFLLPFVIGIAVALDHSIALAAFGTTALISTMPLLSLQILGIIYKVKQKKKNKVLNKTRRKQKIEIIEFGD